jgi:hypothetical protein
VIRQMIRLKDGDKYIHLLKKINSIIYLLSIHSIFPNVDIKKYLFRMNKLLQIIDEKKTKLLEAINTIRNLYQLKGEEVKFKFKIIVRINNLIYKYKMYIKYSKELIVHIHQLLDMEKVYKIDHNLIELNNIERSYLGKISEYTVNKFALEYVNLLNKKEEKKYYYEMNLDIIKLLNIHANHTDTIKGEVDGIIISFDGNQYMIEKIIEVKSSIKATFDDIKKFISLKEYIINNHFNIQYGEYLFTKDSFNHIINKNISDWVVYICINGNNYSIIEKSHLYFSTVLKIIDDEFIKDFYIDKNQKIIEEKYKIIQNNSQLIDNLFNNWIDHIRLGYDNCNVFIVKKTL